MGYSWHLLSLTLCFIFLPALTLKRELIYVSSMARRKRTSIGEDLFEMFLDIFMHIPSWICVPAAGVGYVGVRLLINSVPRTQPFLTVLADAYGGWIAGIFAVMIVIAGIVAAIRKQERRKLLDKQSGLDTLRELSWSEFELLVGEAYRRLGYRVMETGGGGPDGGIDLVLRDNSGQTVIVQCKQWRVYKVGVKPIRELYGVMTSERASRAIFVTTGVYTGEATRFAKGKPVELVDGEALVRLIAPIRAGATVSSQHQASSPVAQLRVNAASIADPVAIAAIADTPSCPTCKASMVLRTARTGANTGSQFWGCSGYPRCRGTRKA
jgi:restriction system protein